MTEDVHYYETLVLIRQFETLLLDKFSTGVFHGTTHTSLGGEAVAVGVLTNLKDGDVVVSNHRCHGHFLAYGGDPQALFAELMGKSSGVCGGVGGSQHLHWQNFYSNGIQGGTVAMASGMAFAEKRLGRDTLVVDFLGDGTLGEGIIYECFNMVSLWKVPILFVLENNHIAQSTPIHLAQVGDPADRFRAFKIPAQHLATSDVRDIAAAAEKEMTMIRKTGGPRALVIDTARLGTHSKGDDTRSEAVLAELWQTRDPVAIEASRLSEDVRHEVEMRVEAQIQKAFDDALHSGEVEND
jgi:TPP-dependent pyruvate/acetoin dehydrogenase alpha subunit